MRPCVMCKKEFKTEELDFLERCEPCFRAYVTAKDEDKPKISKPFVPIYNGDLSKRYGR